MVGRKNVMEGGESRLWSLEAETGNYEEGEFQSGALDKYLLFNHALGDPWETIYFNDRLVKHEARAYVGKDGGSAFRDIIVNFIRKPLKGKVDRLMEREKLIPI